MKLYRDNWDRRRWAHTTNSPRVRRSLRRAQRWQRMPGMHWDAYLLSVCHKPLIHKGGKP